MLSLAYPSRQGGDLCSNNIDCERACELRPVLE